MNQPKKSFRISFKMENVASKIIKIPHVNHEVVFFKNPHIVVETAYVKLTTTSFFNLHVRGLSSSYDVDEDGSTTVIYRGLGSTSASIEHRDLDTNSIGVPVQSTVSLLNNNIEVFLSDLSKTQLIDGNVDECLFTLVIYDRDE